MIGAWLDDDAGSTSGSAYVFVRGGGSWSQQAKLTAADAAAGDQFGLSVSVSGDTAVIGAFGDDDAGSTSGSAYVFVRDGGSWSQLAKLTAAGAAAGDQFGLSVSVSGDTAVVGAFGDDDAGSTSGSAYVFVRDGGSWSQLAKLTAAGAAAGDQFGRSVSVSGDTAVIGAWLDDDGGSNSGSAYVFVRGGGSWSQQAKLTAADAAAGDQFGFSVSVSGDTAVVGAAGDDDAGSTSGSAYVFVRSGGAWSQQAKLTAADAAAGDLFGWFVSLSGDTAVIGAFGDDDAGSNSGSAYVFVPEDTTAPLVTPPGNITVDASEPGGTPATNAAIAAFLAGASAVDDVDGPIAPSNNAPGTFPLGPTLVTFSATDAAANTGTATATVTVLAPRAVKEAVIADLTPFAGESKRIENAITAIEKSLEAKRWVDDSHLDAKHGKKVFDEERKAVKELEKALEKDALSPEAAAAVSEAIERLVSADRVLALTALEEAAGLIALDPERQDKVDRELTKAVEELARGDAERVAGNPDKAIEHYKKAWEKVQKALKQAAKPPDDDDDDDDHHDDDDD